MNIKGKNNFIVVVLIFLWCVITLIRVLHHSPWYDEAHAWVIAQDLNLFEIIKFMKIEGHTFIWYLLLMPFAKTNFMYPYSMLLLNWLFCFIAVLILWLKAPFNNWIKFLISFSFPFLAMYPILARCYAIGIMFLFVITAMENEKLKHPNWYALLLILCANTSVIAAVGATVFGFIFIYEMIKNKVKLFIPLVIMFLGAVIMLLQLPFSLGNNVLVNSVSSPLTINAFKSTFIYNSLVLNISIIISLLVLMSIFFVKNKIFPTFLIFSYTILSIVFSKYLGSIWHHFFYYIYLVIAVWLLLIKYEKQKFIYPNLLTMLLAIISFIYIFYNYSDYKEIYSMSNKEVKIYIDKILNDENLKNSDMLIYNNYGYYALIPRLKNSGINLINYCTATPLNYDTNSFFKTEYCYLDKKTMSFKRLISPIQLNEIVKDKAYLLTDNKNLNVDYLLNNNIILTMRYYKTIDEGLYIFLIEKKIYK